MVPLEIGPSDVGIMFGLRKIGWLTKWFFFCYLIRNAFGL